MGDVCTLKGSFVHVLEEDLNFTIVIDEVVTSDDVRVVDFAKNLNFTAHLIADGVFVVAVDHFEGVDFAGGAVENFVDGSTSPAADAADTLQLGIFQLQGG